MEKKRQIRFWSWKVPEEELKAQVENYNTLKVTQSYRGVVVISISALLLLTLIISLFGIIFDPGTVLFSLIIYVPILIFTYRGHRWAIITLLILWTIEKVSTAMMSIEMDSSPLSSIIFWLAIAPSIYNALRVENLRKKKINPVAQPAQVPTFQTHFCSGCGNKLNPQVNFCNQCGTKIS